MPVPTDTFWNISRLNKVFALSALLLLATFVGAVFEDFFKDWREPQRDGKVWEAALVDERLEDAERLAAQSITLDAAIEAKRQEVEASGGAYDRLTAERNQLSAQLANLDFRTNTLKAEVSEQLKFLEDARTAGDNERVAELREKLAGPSAKLEEYVEEQGRLRAEIETRKQELARITAGLDALKKERKLLTDERDALAKKRDALQPPTLTGKTFTLLRQAPLLQFINPAENVKQTVVPDVLVDLGGVKTVPAIDRCVTCHVNIDKKDFTEERVLNYLEEQLATVRKLNLPETATGKGSDPVATRLAPGATAMPEFWTKLAASVSPELLKKPGLANRSRTLFNAIGPSKTATAKTTQLDVTVDGKPLDALAYKADATGEALDLQQSVLATIIETWLRYVPGDKATASLSRGRVTVTVAGNTTDANASTARRVATLLIEDYRDSLLAAVDAKQGKIVRDRYRRGLIAEVNVARDAGGLPELDPSPVLLAHPRLDLYAEVDSKHPIEKVGCTSCHDGSGLETRFILAAHTPRPIWVDRDSGAPVLPQQLKPTAPLTHDTFTMASMLQTVFPAGALSPKVDSLHLPDPAAHPSTRPASIEPPAEPPLELASAVEYVDPVTGTRGRAVSQKAYWKKKYEFESGQSMETTEHYWDFPMRPPEFVQANCVRCHTSVHDVKEYAPVVHRGRQLFTNLGCNNCHLMDGIPTSEQRKVGTDLRHVASKLSPAMINTWVWAPKSFRPTTKMPHFFMLENNSSDEELRRTRQEALAMTEYLVQTSDPLVAKHKVPSGLTGKVDEGRKVFNTIGCLACHQNLSDPVGGERNGKPITRAEQWITQDMEGSGRLAEEMARQNGKPPSKAELQAEAVRRFDAMSYNERQLYADRYLGEGENPDGKATYPFLQKDGKPVAKPLFMQHGPELSAVGQKLTAGGRTPEQARAWLFDWLKEPRHYSKYTIMPSFRLSDQQAVDLVEYLLAQSRQKTHPDDPWQAGLMETDSAKLVELTSLFLRSRYTPKVAVTKADDEAELRLLAADALRNAKTDQAAAERKVAAMDKDQMRKVFLGKKLISHYGCMQCHAINGTEQMASPCPSLTDWGQKLVSKLDYNFLDAHKAHGLPEQKIPMVNGLAPEASKLSAPMPAGAWTQPVAEPVTAAWPHVAHTRDDWLMHKLHNTRIFDRGRASLDPQREIRDGQVVVTDPGKPYDKIKMPTFYLSEDEVNAISTFVLSNRARLVTPTITAAATGDRAQRIAHGRYLVTEKFNCTSCHIVESNQPQIRQYYSEADALLLAPPQLRSEGSRINHAWLYGFLKNPTTIRPKLADGIRMPTFHASDDEWTSIIAYFNDVANKESQDLRKHIDPILAYKESARARLAAVNGDASAEAMTAGQDWFVRPNLAGNVAYLREWGLEHRYVVPTDVALVGSVADRAAGYEKLLYAARLVQRAYKAPYPFVEAPTTDVSKERFELGEKLFLEIDCLKCHAMGEVSPGVDQQGPNFHLLHGRIRRGWAQHWVKDPPIIHMGSAMNPQFSGIKTGDPRGQTHWRQKDASPEEIARTEAAYGKTAEEQIELLFDYIYAASARKHQTDRQVYDEKNPPPSKQMAEQGLIKYEVPKPATQPVATPAAETPKAPETPAAPDKPAPTPPPHAAKAPTGTVTGVVTLTGKPPEPAEINMAAVKECHAQHTDPPVDESVVVSAKGELKNVVVSIKKEEGSDLTGEIPKEAAVIDQRGCMYAPHVLPVMVGQEIVVKNTDNFTHNVHSFSRLNPAFNFEQKKDPGKKIEPMKTAETFVVKCDVHPWMQMHVVAFDHPYFAVSGDDGSFKLPPLPAGTHTLRFWHEKFGTIEKEVTVEAGKPLEVKVAFDSK